jgi:hypothetical protein
MRGHPSGSAMRRRGCSLGSNLANMDDNNLLNIRGVGEIRSSRHRRMLLASSRSSLRPQHQQQQPPSRHGGARVPDPGISGCRCAGAHVRIRTLPVLSVVMSLVSTPMIRGKSRLKKEFEGNFSIFYALIPSNLFGKHTRYTYVGTYYMGCKLIVLQRRRTSIRSPR